MAVAEVVETQCYKTAEAAKLFGVCRSTLIIAANQGRVPAFRFGRDYRFPKQPIDKMLAEGRMITTAEFEDGED